MSARRRLDDLRLTATNRGELRELVDEQRFARELRDAGLDARHRLLLVGPPGTGKTSLAEALAAEIGLPLFVLQYEAIIGSFLGETSGRLGQALTEVASRPAVLFIDEFDTIAKERSDEHDTGEVKRVVSTLLLQLDRLPSHVILVAATNHGELLDRAAWRRFQVVLRLENPDPDERAAFASEMARKIGLSPSKELEARARTWESGSYALIEEMVLSERRREVLSALRSNDDVASPGRVG